MALVAAAVYLAFVLYGDWDGGSVGHWTASALENGFGQVAFAVPVALALWGLALVSRPFLSAPGALNVGGVLVLSALLLGFAAGTAGLGPAAPARDGYFEPDFFREHGGAAGEVLYWASTTLFQRLGAHIIAVLLMLSGLLLCTGSTVSGLLVAWGRTARRAGDGTRVVARTLRTSAPPPREPGPWGDPEADGSAAAHLDEPRTLETRAFAEDAGREGGDRGSWVDPGDEEEEAGDENERFVYEEAIGGVVTPQEVEVIASASSSEEVERTPMGNRRTGGITESDEIEYALPSADKLLEQGKHDPGPDRGDREAVAKALLEALRHFGVEARMVGTVSGPHVSRYELQLAPGTKVSKVTQLKDDLAYALASTDIRILAPIPGKKAVGVEVPNRRRRMVRLGDIYDGRPKGSSPLAVWLGKDVAGHSQWTDLALMPHALVAGTTGSGKSGCINTMLCSILLHASPNEVRLVLVDPKRVELNHYERLPHLLTPVVTNPRLASTVLANLIGEMEERYAVMGEARARNLVELNRARRRTGEAPLPHILCVIDELADLMMVAPAEVEDSIIRLAQKSRAVGIHLVLATQRPSTDVITGTIKVNIPARIGFAVASQVDSRVILDGGGAESLLGQGDMLFRGAGSSKLVRIQGAFVTEEEIARLTRHWARQGQPEFDPELLQTPLEDSEAGGGEFSADQDDLLEEAARTVVQGQTASVSMLQRRLRVGYTRAGRLVDMLERRGIISGYEGSKPRQVLVSEADLPRVLGSGAETAGAGPEASTDTELESLVR